MGAINYRSSNYITLATRPATAEDLKNDPIFMQFANQEIEEAGAELDGIIDYELYEMEQTDRENAEEIMAKYSFYYFHIVLLSGYYEGYSIDIEPNFGLCYETYQDKQEAQKEITELKNMLVELACVGFKACRPGWSTSWSDHNETLKEIRRAVAEMREEVRATPTWRQFEKESA